MARRTRDIAAQTVAVAKAAATAATAARTAADCGDGELGVESAASEAEDGALHLMTEIPWLSRHLPAE
ncbi:hypothetical protein ABZU45_42005 [Streptomyces avermitilis]|uniref:hypothetical protein n=1 Tax=Streptomyces avermitilis TaxID=33903 RepID=UPI00339DE4EC